MTMLHRYLQLSFIPRVFQIPGVSLPATHHSLQPAIFNQSTNADPPEWLNSDLARPVVHVTLGTVFGEADLLKTVAGAVQDEVGTVIITVGRNLAPDSLGSQPAHIRVEQYIPHNILLSRCDAIVTHGGLGTIVAALANELPLVVIPISADQPANAERVVSLGLGRSIPREDQTPEAISEAVKAVLTDPAYRDRVRELRNEVAALPGLEYAVTLLEGLAAEGTPRMAAT